MAKCVFLSLVVDLNRLLGLTLRKTESFEADLGGQTDDRLSLIWGAEMGDTNLVVAMSELDRSALPGTANTNYSQLAISGLGNSFLLFGPSTVESGPYAGTYAPLQNVPDANCVANKGVIIPQASGERCGFYYGDRFNIVNDEDHSSVYASMTTSMNGMDFEIDYMNTTIDVNDNLIKETCEIIGCDKEELFNKPEEKLSNYYSFFSLSNSEVDNLILEASTQETFEDAANLILKNLKKDNSKLTSRDIRSLLHKLKDNHSLPA